MYIYKFNKIKCKKKKYLFIIIITNIKNEKFINNYN